MTEEKLAALATLVATVVVTHQKMGISKQFFMDAISGAWDLNAGILTKNEALKQMEEKHPLIMRPEKAH